MMVIKRATVSDARVISFLAKKTFTETFADLFSKDELYAYLDETFNIGKLERSLLKSQNIFGIFYYVGKPVGYYKIKQGMHYDHSADEHDVQLQKIYVLQDYLHLGFGKEMLIHALNLEEIKDCKMMWLVVLHTNKNATLFYEHHRFEKLKGYYYTIGSQRLEYNLMIKKL
jgi:diamine N-acetyltransferase